MTIKALAQGKDTCITCTINKIVGAAPCAPRVRRSLGRKQTHCGQERRTIIGYHPTQCNITPTRCFPYYTGQLPSNTAVISTMSYHNETECPANISMYTPQMWPNDSIRVRPGDTNQTKLDGMAKKLFLVVGVKTCGACNQWRFPAL